MAHTATDRERAAVAISVVVPVLDAAGTIGRTLSALASQALETPFEVTIVDGGSTDGTLQILARAPANITVLHNPDKEPAGSRNLGVRASHGRALAFTDADCEPDPDWLAAGLRALERADIVQGKVLPREQHGPFDRTLAVLDEYGLYETANLFVRRETFDGVGGFEPLPGLTLPDGSHFGEDAWFVWRAKRRGAVTTFAETALVRHAVVRRGLRAFLAEQRRRSHFPALVGLIPELRQSVLHHAYFLSPASLHFDLALAGTTAAAISRRPLPLLAALPYATTIAKAARGRPADQRRQVIAARLAGDAVTCASLIRGSARARRLVA